MASLNVTVSGLARPLFPSYLIFNFCYFGEYTHGDGVPRVKFTLPIETEKVLHGSWQSYWGYFSMHTTRTRWCGVSREISREPGQRRGVIPGALTNDSPRSLTGCSLNKKEKRQRSMSFHKCKCFICESGRWNLVQLKFQIKCINTSTAIVRLWIMENPIIHLERLFYFTGYQEKKRLVNLLDKSQLALRGKKIFTSKRTTKLLNTIFY